MVSVADFSRRAREAVAGAGRAIGRALRRSGHRVVVALEERPRVGPVEVDLPYSLPTRDEPLALALFVFAAVTVVFSISLVLGSLALLGEVPWPLVLALGALALVLGVAGNLSPVATYTEERSTQLLRPLIGLGLPVMDRLHTWFNPVVTVLLVLLVLSYDSNNWLLLPAVALMLAWTVTGLLLKLPRDSPWNGPMLVKWAGYMHRRPFVYVIVVVLVAVSLIADYVE